MPSAIAHEDQHMEDAQDADNLATEEGDVDAASEDGFIDINDNRIRVVMPLLSKDLFA